MSVIDLGYCIVFAETCLPEEGADRLRAAGFDGVELWPAPLDRFGIKRWRQTLADSGLRCLQYCPYFDFVSGPARVRETREIFVKSLEIASELECRRLRVFTGPPWGEKAVGARLATEAQWQSAIEELREMCPVAERYGIELCLECHEGSLMENAPSALRLLRGVDHPALTVNLQLPFVDETWEDSVDRLGAYTTHIHIHNWTQGLGQGDLTFLGEGAFDWMPALDHLVRRLGRSLCLSVEHADHGGRHDPWETARRDGVTLQNWRSILLKTS